MSTKANSISVAKLSAAAHNAAQAALAKTSLRNAVIDPGIVMDHPWIIGIIFRNPDVAQFAQYQQVASQVTAALVKSDLNPQPLPPGISESLYIYDHIIICGYRPVTELPVTVE
jgi:hypothetical protein